jgi:hypothetical protein
MCLCYTTTLYNIKQCPTCLITVHLIKMVTPHNLLIFHDELQDINHNTGHENSYTKLPIKHASQTIRISPHNTSIRAALQIEKNFSELTKTCFRCQNQYNRSFSTVAATMKYNFFKLFILF